MDRQKELLEEISFDLGQGLRGISWHEIADIIGGNEHTKIGLKIAKSLYDYADEDNGTIVVLQGGHWYNDLNTDWSKGFPYRKQVKRYIKKYLGIDYFMTDENVILKDTLSVNTNNRGK